MKKIDNIILTVFSILIFLASILIICIIAGWIKIDSVSEFVNMALAKQMTSRIILGLAIVCLIASFKAIFFSGTTEKENKKGVLMQNDNGKLLISKSTIENIVQGVAKGFDSVEVTDVSSDFDDLNNLSINVSLIVGKNVIIKELTVNLQNKIKETIKRTSDLDVKEVNVKIKDIYKEDKYTIWGVYYDSWNPTTELDKGVITINNPGDDNATVVLSTKPEHVFKKQIN